MDPSDIVIASWPVRWTAINSPLSSPPHQANTTTLDEGITDAAMLETQTSQHVSHLRNNILDSASRLTAGPSPKRAQRKRPAPSAPRKKRPAAVAFDFTTDQPGQSKSQAATTERPAKAAKLTTVADACQPLQPVSSAKFNSLPSQRQISGPPKANGVDTTPPTKPFTFPSAPRKGAEHVMSPSFHTQSNYPRTGESGTRSAQWSLSASNPSASSLISETGKRGPTEPLLPSSAPASSIDGIDYLGDDCLFGELLDREPSLQGTISPSLDSSDSQPLGTSTKMLPTKIAVIAPTPPSLASPSRTSPASASPTPITPSPALIPFIRKQQASDIFPNLPQLPSLKADNRIVTCFRIAEVLRLQSTLSDSAPLAGIRAELYAGVASCTSKDNAHLFRFADLFFPDRPPYLTGTYDAEESTLFASDVRSITGPTKGNFKLCRAIIQVKQKRTSRSHGKGAADVKVLSVWETDWEDVERVRGIVEPEYQAGMSQVHVESPGDSSGYPAKKSEVVRDVQIMETGSVD